VLVTSGRRGSGLHRVLGLTLIEVVTAMAIASAVASSLYLLLGAGIKGYLIEHARVTNQERGRQALMWLADRVRQANYDPQAPCPDGLLMAGDGTGFLQRLAFRAILDESLPLRRQTYAYYVEGRTLWQETLLQEAAGQCDVEVGRTAPAPERVALTPPVVRTFQLGYLDRNGMPTSTPGFVRWVHVTLTFEVRSIAGRTESETSQTLVAVRSP
jgi:prepilin-type N-terminal cleavage/methylation domain-containing protein